MEERSVTIMSGYDNDSLVDAKRGRLTPVVKIEAEQTAGINGAESNVKTSALSSSNNNYSDNRFHDYRIYVSNIPFSFRNRDLIEMFSPFGKVSNAEVVMNERGSKGFGFVTLDTKQGSEAARASLNGTVVNGRVIEVKKATTLSARRNCTSSRTQQSAVLGSNVFLPPNMDLLTSRQFPQIQPQPFGHTNTTEQLNALLLAQNQLNFQPMINPIASNEMPYSTLLVHRQLPHIQQHALVASGIPISPVGIPSIPLHLLYATPNGINTPSSNHALATAVVPLSTAGLGYTPIPSVNQGTLLFQSAVPCKLAQEVSNNTKGYIDLLGSLGLGNGIAPPSQTVSNNTTHPGAPQNLRSLDQSCVIDTSLHGEPLKEGQFGPIGSALQPGNVNQASLNSDILAQTAASPDVHAFGCPSGNESLYTIPVYHQFEQSNDRNGRKRQSNNDEHPLNRKVAKPG
ncbi:hypothetical protein DICVIV_03307 [Dictyocaulus viviparus]|uniref:RRM domain-containing protein n=1 Tax=Dictyocaulus viviparus TaxID=29172 RepID=A0A0D8Y2Y7_DICVI|nr:hypothetical protein DICVIV_03307 [Dictyocaulus viviparus]